MYLYQHVWNLFILRALGFLAGNEKKRPTSQILVGLLVRPRGFEPPACGLGNPSYVSQFTFPYLCKSLHVILVRLQYLISSLVSLPLPCIVAVLIAV